jgi:hypothetical protein
VIPALRKKYAKSGAPTIVIPSAVQRLGHPPFESKDELRQNPGTDETFPVFLEK